MTSGIVLVVIARRDSEIVYSRYKGRECTHIHSCVVPLSDYWVRILRDDPEAFYDTPAGADAA